MNIIFNPLALVRLGLAFGDTTTAQRHICAGLLGEGRLCASLSGCTFDTIVLFSILCVSGITCEGTDKHFSQMLYHSAAPLTHRYPLQGAALRCQACSYLNMCHREQDRVAKQRMPPSGFTKCCCYHLIL